MVKLRLDSRIEGILKIFSKNFRKNIGFDRYNTARLIQLPTDIAIVLKLPDLLPCKFPKVPD